MTWDHEATIERLAESAMNRLDKHLLAGRLTQDEYERRVGYLRTRVEREHARWRTGCAPWVYVWQMNNGRWHISPLGGRDELPASVDYLAIVRADLDRGFETRTEAREALRTAFPRASAS